MGKRAKKKATFEWTKDGDDPVRVTRATRREKKAQDERLVPIAKELLGMRPAERKRAPISEATAKVLEDTLRIKKGARIAIKRSTDLLVGMLRNEDVDNLLAWLGQHEDLDGTPESRSWLAQFLKNRWKAIEEFQEAFPSADPGACQEMRALANQAAKAPTGKAATELLALIDQTLEQVSDDT